MMDSSPDSSLHLRRNSRDSRDTSYMDFAQGIDSDIEETTTTTTATTDTLAAASQLKTMDPPSPILPPPPGSISPPRFLNEDFDCEDEDNGPLAGKLNAAELLIEPPPPPMMAGGGPGSRSNTMEEESADEGEEEDEEQTIIQNKLKMSSGGLDSLTSDMAAKLQSMISEEIEETIPRDPEGSEGSDWSSGRVTISSPPMPVWREESVVTSNVTGSVDEDEEDDESSGNSQSPKQVHKIVSPPPPPPAQEEEEEEEEVPMPEKW